jgi:hypothetical protein
VALGGTVFDNYSLVGVRLIATEGLKFSALVIAALGKQPIASRPKTDRRLMWITSSRPPRTLSV